MHYVNMYDKERQDKYMKLFSKIEVWARYFVGLELICLIATALIAAHENYQHNTYSTGQSIGEVWIDAAGEPIHVNGFENAKKGQCYTIYYTIPHTTADQILAFRSRHLYLDIYVNDTLISSDNHIDSWIFSPSTGNRWHYIPLGKHDTSVTVRIDATAAFSSSRCALNRMFLGTHQEVIRATTVPLLGTFLFSCLLFIIGLALFFFFVFFRKKLPMGRDIIYLSICTMLTTLWTSMESLFLQFLFGYTEMFQITAYLSLIAIPLPLGLLGYNRFKGKEKVFAGFYVTISILNVLICSILHFSGISDYHDLLTPTHVLFALTIPLLTILVRNYLQDEITKKHRKTLLALLITTSIGITIGLVGYAAGIFVDYSIMALVAIASLNVFLLLYNFNVFVDMFRKGLEADFIHELALRDYMTNLYNRTGFAEHQATYARLIEHKTPIGILQFDLNNLKTVNDTLGHDQGDLLIASFAACLQASFVGKGNCYRMGGDEFLVILNGQDPEKDYRIGIDALRQYCDDHNRTTGISYCMEAAHGFVLSQGMPLADAMAMADARMYETKKILKENKEKA